MDQQTFQATFGNVFEHSPWVAEAVFKTGVGDLLSDARKLSGRFKSVFLKSNREQQLTTLRAHPPLVCSLAEPQELTNTSAMEQSAAGLDQCTEIEFAEFSRLNAEYSAKFGFPFIIAVKGRTRLKILELFRMRLKNDAVLEYQTALMQVCRIARFRIGNILDA